MGFNHVDSFSCIELLMNTIAMVEEKLRRIICCSGGLYAVQEGYMLFRRLICCSGGLNAVQEGYILFRRVICCSGGLDTVQEGYILFRRVI